MNNDVLLYDVREDIKEIYDEWYDEYQHIVKTSYSNALSNLNPGEKVPSKGVIHGDVYQESFRQATMSYKERLNNILDKEETRIREDLAEAPSDEATRAVNMFLLGIPQIDLTKNPVEREKFLYAVDSLMTKYPNYLTYIALEKVVKDAGLIDAFKVPKTAKECVLIKELRDIVDHTFVSWPAPALDDARKALFDSTIDNAGNERPGIFA